MNLWSQFKRFLCGEHTRVEAHVEELKRQNEEVRRDLQNVKRRSKALWELIAKMRSDETWERGSEQRGTDVDR